MANEKNVVYVDKERLEKIKEELAYLRSEKRPEVARRLELAIAEGDISENADYDYAKQEQAFTEGRILDLEDSLRRAQIIVHDGKTNVIRIGSKVTLLEVGEEDKETFEIVGVLDADPAQGKISNESPIAKALLGAKKKQTVTVTTPGGALQFKILDIS